VKVEAQRPIMKPIKNRASLWPLLAALALAGCGRSKPSVEPVKTQPEGGKVEVASLLPRDATPAEAPVTPGDAAPPPANPPETTATAENAGIDWRSPDYDPKTPEQIVDQLQAALEKYYLANVSKPTRREAPKTLQELVKGGFLRKLPTAPAGKKIVYHPENWLVTVEDAK
jgi:hypothetical protein